MQSITPEQLKQLIDNSNSPELIDIREPWEYETCRIDSSTNLPMSGIVNSHEKLDKKAKNVVICHHGARSLQVTSYLESIGFENVINLEGGIDLWAKTIDPSMPQY